MSTSDVATPVVILGLFLLALPVSIPTGASRVSDLECLTLPDSPPVARLDLTGILERCTAVYPRDVELLADLGAQYERTGQTNQAETIYGKALLIDPEYAELRLRLGRLLLQRGARAEARDQAARALRVQPNRQALLDLLDAAGTPLVENDR